MRETDIDAVLDMAAELSSHEGMPNPDLTYEKLHEVMFGQSAFVYGSVARKDIEPVGYVFWNIGYDMQHGTRTLNIIDLFVKQTDRRQSIARFLLSKLASLAMERGYKFMTVQASARNEEANAFYGACGAKLDRTNTYYFTQTTMEAL